MSKYEPLWQYVRDCGSKNLLLTFAEIERITGFSLDHAFLTYKKELGAYGWRVEKISLKKQCILFVSDATES